MRRKTKWTVLGLVTLPVTVALIGATYQQLATTRDLAASPAPGIRIDIGGHRVHLWCMGSGAPTVVLETGLGGSAFSWAPVQPLVARSTRVCSYDCAGFGYSDAGPSPRTSGRIAEELGRLMAAAHLDGPLVLAGASSGGFSARILASTRRDLVAGLVLIDASHEDQNARLAAAGLLPPVPPALGFVTTLASFGVLRLRGATLGLNPDRADPSVQRYVRATMHRASRYKALYGETMAWEASAAEVRASRRKLDIPLVVLTAGVWSDAGRQIHSDLQRDQVALSTRACQVVVDRSGHDIVGDAPERVVAAIRAVTDAVRSGGVSPACRSSAAAEGQ